MSEGGDKADLRLEQQWKALHSSAADSLPKPQDASSVLIVGYPDDEGVRLNKGRGGAAEGPSHILKYLGRMVCRKSPEIVVIENLLPALGGTVTLSERHQKAREIATKALSLGWRLVTLGGGHDYGYADASAYHVKTKGKILNLDSHLDMRPVLQNSFHSGTPFRRFVEEFGGQSLIEYGYWPHANAESHEDFGRQNKVVMLQANEALPPLEGQVGLSVCLDAFAGIRGVSAPQMVGLSPERGLDIIKRFRHQSDWLGLYEVAPALDPSTHDSARLAALLAYYFIHRDL